MCPRQLPAYFNQAILVYRPDVQFKFDLPEETISKPRSDLSTSGLHQPVANQGPAPQTHGVSKTDFERYVTANDAVLRNMQNQGQNLQSQMANLTDMLSKFVTANTASTSGSGTLPGNTVTNPKEDLKAVILNKLPKKLGDPGRFLIPCEFTGITTCNALADLGASINLMPYSVWKSLSLSDLTPTCMTLELADRSITEPIGIAEDALVNVGKFQFPADFVFHALIDVYEGEITLRVGKEAITFNLDQTSKYTADYNHMTVNKIDVIDMACDEYSQELLHISLFRGTRDFFLFEKKQILSCSGGCNPTSSEVDPTYQDPEGDILILEAILNSEPPPPLPNHEQYMPEVRKELKLCEAKTVEPSIDEPPEVELKELPPHLEYAFLEGDNKLPVIIAKDLKDEEKAALLKVLKSHKRAIAWKLSDIKGVSPEFCTHKILMEEDYEPFCCNSIKKGNPKIHDVIKRRLKILLDAGIVLLHLSDSPWVSPVHCVPKKGENFPNEATQDKITSHYHSWNNARKTRQKRQLSHALYETFAYRRMPFGYAMASRARSMMYDGNLHDID
ncbi:reverse transcriptase domain-containing protein [Tanacetum coccineum]|uniref:Reverse transcriptase domain-containing protein n=1 Tax=Tanacetum coccineum TaxID=301880 RepID=A0ABQ5G5K4_9ASTR